MSDDLPPDAHKLTVNECLVCLNTCKAPERSHMWFGKWVICPSYGLDKCQISERLDPHSFSTASCKICIHGHQSTTDSIMCDSPTLPFDRPLQPLLRGYYPFVCTGYIPCKPLLLTGNYVIDR